MAEAHPMKDWTPDVVQELKAQGVRVTLITPQKGLWHIEDKYILNTEEMKHLKEHGKLNLDGIKELDTLLKLQRKKKKP